MTKIFSSLYTLLVVVLGIATLVEDQTGRFLYGEPWFVVLLALFALAGATLAVKQRVWTSVPQLLTTTSVALMLVGAFVSYTIGERGYVELRKEQPCKHFRTDDGLKRELPFTMTLDSFAIRYYKGTTAHSDYVSYLKIDGEEELASMNRNLVKDGYRFCQSSFEGDQVSILSVNHDPWGTNTTFAGYALFVVAGIVTLLWPNGRVRQLLKQLQANKSGFLTAALLALTLAPQPGKAETGRRQVPVISKEEALGLQRRQVVYQNRIVPFNTVATDFVKKLYGKPNYKGLMPEQVVGGWSIAPNSWKDEKIIKVKSALLRTELGLDGTYCSLADLFTADGTYRLQALYNKESAQKGVSKLEKAINELDEKVGIVLMLGNNTLMKPLPEDGSVSPLPETKVTAELLYNRIPFSKVLFMANLTLGILAFGLFMYRGISGKKHKWIDVALKALTCLLLASLLFHSFGYGLRWYISGRIPLNNGFETMQFLALSIMLLAIVLCRRYRFVLVFGFLMSGFTLLVAHLGEMNPQITPLMPVLNSPWLSTHVSLIMMSYALFAFIMLNSVFALVLEVRGKNEPVEQLTLMNQLLLYPAVIFIGIGILLGSVWANESWGTYWGWDPKEVWALISFMIYGAGIVFSESKWFKNKTFFHWYMALAFLSVLMTYFGVNYLLGGMHSYAG